MGFVSVSGGKDFKASVFSLYQENGKAVFYVRPFSKELKDELERLTKDAPKVSKTVDVTEKNGTYRISSMETLSGIDFIESFWGILFRRFKTEANYVCLDPVNSERYYIAIFSHQYIEPCERRLAV